MRNVLAPLLVTVVPMLMTACQSADPWRDGVEPTYAGRTAASWAEDLSEAAFAEYERLSVEAAEGMKAGKRREMGDESVSYDRERQVRLGRQMSEIAERADRAAFAISMIGPPHSFVAVQGLVRQLRFRSALHAKHALTEIGVTSPLYTDKSFPDRLLYLPTGASQPDDVVAALTDVVKNGRGLARDQAAEVLADIAIGQNAGLGLEATRELLLPLKDKTRVSMALDKMARAEAAASENGR